MTLTGSTPPHAACFCRHCAAPLDLLVADLGTTPVSNDYVDPADADGPEPWYPLRAYVCRACRLVQLQDFRRADSLFRADYPYFSSMSRDWLDHAKRYAALMIGRQGLTASSHVVEVASNDGYLLRFFKQAGIRVTGIEPSASVAEAARRNHGIPSLERFFGEATARAFLDEIGPADLMAANNVLAHVPDINDFVRGFTVLLKKDGVATFEFPHLLNLLAKGQFDTIYHEHYSYLSLLAAERVFRRAGLRVFDAETLPTHGGSLRLYVCHDGAVFAPGPGLDAIRRDEQAHGLDTDAPYLAFAECVREAKRALLTLLIGLKRDGKRIAAYGAPAKGNTLLNYCGIGTDMIDFTVDRAPSKQGRLLPGSRIPILAPEAIRDRKPDHVLILPWNLAREITADLSYIRDWGGHFIIPIPEPRLLP